MKFTSVLIIFIIFFSKRISAQLFPSSCDGTATVSVIDNPISPCLNGGYTLKFEDNFNGNSLDMDKWELI